MTTLCRKTRNSKKASTIQQPPVTHRHADLTNDWSFKHIFGEVISQSGNQNDFTRDLLNNLLELSGEEEITEVRFRDSVLPSVNITHRSYITDVYCVDKSGKKFIIEMQVAKHDNWAERMQVYVARDFGNQMKRGEDYNSLLPVHLVAVTSFDMFPEGVDFLSHHTITEGKTKECFFKGMQWTVLELTKFNKSASEIQENKDRWAFLLKNGPSISNMSDSDKIFLMCDPVIRDAYARLDMSTWTEQDRLIYEDIEDKRKVAAGVSREDRKKGEQIGIEKGIEIGRELERKKFEEENNKNTIGIIRMMLENGSNDEFIKKVVNANGKYTDAALDNMINGAKEEIQFESNKHRHV